MREKSAATERGFVKTNAVRDGQIRRLILLISICVSLSSTAVLVNDVQSPLRLTLRAAQPAEREERTDAIFWGCGN